MAPVYSRDYVLSGIYFSVLEPRHVRIIMWLVNTPSKQETLTQCWSNAAGPSLQRWSSIKPGLVQCLMFADSSWSDNAYCWWRLQADTDPMSGKCWSSVAGAEEYPFNPSQYIMLAPA